VEILITNVFSRDGRSWSTSLYRFFRDLETSLIRIMRHNRTCLELCTPLSTDVNHWVGTARWARPSIFLGRAYHEPWGDKVWGFGKNSVQVIVRGRDRSTRSLVGVGWTNQGASEPTDEQPNTTSTPFLFPVEREIWERQNHARSIPRSARGSRLRVTTRVSGKQGIVSTKLPKGGSFGEERKSFVCSSPAAASFQKIGRTPRLSSHERLSATAASE
jgi:hypothetical protein